MVLSSQLENPEDKWAITEGLIAEPVFKLYKTVCAGDAAPGGLKHQDSLKNPAVERVRTTDRTSRKLKDADGPWKPDTRRFSYGGRSYRDHEYDGFALAATTRRCSRSRDICTL